MNNHQHPHQQQWDFDLDPKLQAVYRLQTPAPVRKLLAALAIFGCCHPSRVVLGEGDEDGEWLTDPSRRDLARAAGVSLSTVKNWLRQARDCEYLAITRSVEDRHDYHVFWAAIFDAAEKLTPVRIDPGQRGQTDPGQRLTPVRIDPGQGGQIDPGQSHQRKQPDHSFSNTTTTNQANQGRRGLGMTITPNHFRTPAGAAELIAAAIRTGHIRDRPEEVEEFAAFLVWLARQPTGEGHGRIRSKAGFLIAALAKGQIEWGHRATPDDRHKARQMLEALNAPQPQPETA